MSYSFAQKSISKRSEIAMIMKGTMGTYANPPLLSNGKIDYVLLLDQLQELHANTYHWLDRAGNYDANELEIFLPLAAKRNINVWVTVVPPSEAPPFSKHYSEPYKSDYKQWAIELAKLSLKYPNLIAWSIDDFVHNLSTFTPEYVQSFMDASRSINPVFAFFPCCYFKQTTPDFAKQYGSIVDGILFPYRNESVQANLTDASHVSSEIATLRSYFDPAFLIFLDIYASPHSHLGASTPEYVEEALRQGRKSADGIMIYRHQHPTKEPAKYAIIQKAFKKGMKK